MEIWLNLHGRKIRNRGVEMDVKPLAELIYMDERLIVVIDDENKKMKAYRTFENLQFSMLTKLKVFCMPRKRSFRELIPPSKNQKMIIPILFSYIPPK